MSFKSFFDKFFTCFIIFKIKNLRQNNEHLKKIAEKISLYTFLCYLVIVCIEIQKVKTEMFERQVKKEYCFY